MGLFPSRNLSNGGLQIPPGPLRQATLSPGGRNGCLLPEAECELGARVVVTTQEGPSGLGWRQHAFAELRGRSVGTLRKGSAETRRRDIRSFGVKKTKCQWTYCFWMI